MPQESSLLIYLSYTSEKESVAPDEVMNHLIGQGVDEETAHDVVRLTPIAFGRLLLADLGIKFTNKYVYFDAGGTTVGSGQLDKNATYQKALEDGSLLKDHPGFELVALSSSEVHTVNSALNAGSSPSDLVTLPVGFFVENPAEGAVEIAQDRIAALAKIEENKASPSIDKSSGSASRAKRPWWRFW